MRIRDIVAERHSDGVMAGHPLLANLFVPEVFLPEQYFDSVRAESTTNIPEVRLMMAVLEEAIASYQRYAIEPVRRNLKGFRDARQWIDSTDTTWPYSFENVCAMLHLEPEVLRCGLRAWREARLQALAPTHPYQNPFRRVAGVRHAIVLKRDRLPPQN